VQQGPARVTLLPVMRKAYEITIDRALLVYLLHLAEPHGPLGDVKLQQLVFLSELQMFGQRLRGFHFEFFRYAYGAFSKDLDNDLLVLRRKERLENFTLSAKGEEVVKVLLEALEAGEVNQRVGKLLRAVVETYGLQDTGSITKSVEAVELAAPDQPGLQLAIRAVSFHTTLLVPSRIEVDAEFTITPTLLSRLNAALGIA
jgi:hypothetical protein